MHEEIAKLFKQLDEAFGRLPIPPEDRLVLANSASSDLESEAIRAKFRHRTWKGLTIDDLVGEADSLCFFTPEAFRFFLPAFIRVALLDPVQADRIPDSILASLAPSDAAKIWAERSDAYFQTARERGIPEKLLLDLAPGEDPELDASCRERVEALTDDQKRAVKSFVSFLRKHRSQEFMVGELERVEEVLGI